jgi:cyclophilin family peptidyl-prolyl cis-trans isomerase
MGQAKSAEQREQGLYMTFETDKGNIACKLFESDAPVTVHKIVGLAVGKIGGKRFYDGLIFHRVIPNFMIQGGDPLGNGTGSPRFPGFPFKDEFVPTLKFDVPGRLAMANSGPNTNGSQFFITEVPTPHLNNRHTIFGQCGNLDVVKAIARVSANPGNNMPTTPVHIKRVIVERVGPAPADAPEAAAPKSPGTATGEARGKVPIKNP